MYCFLAIVLLIVVFSRDHKAAQAAAKIPVEVSDSGESGEAPPVPVTQYVTFAVSFFSHTLLQAPEQSAQGP